MKFKNALIPGKLIKRYKRFLSDIELENGEEVVAHCANSGAMLGLKDPGSSVWLSPSPPESKGKLKYRWELIKADGGLVGINTSHPNTLVQEAIENKTIRDLQGYDSLRREVKYGTNSRIDILLESRTKAPCYVEVKNVHLKRDKQAEFPDAVTARGTKHLNELSQEVKQGNRAVMLYVVQRMDCCSFSFASDIDPIYSEAAIQAKAAGVEFLCYKCHITTSEIKIDKPLEIIGL